MAKVWIPACAGMTMRVFLLKFMIKQRDDMEIQTLENPTFDTQDEFKHKPIAENISLRGRSGRLAEKVRAAARAVGGRFVRGGFRLLNGASEFTQ